MALYKWASERRLNPGGASEWIKYRGDEVLIGGRTHFANLNTGSDAAIGCEMKLSDLADETGSDNLSKEMKHQAKAESYYG